MFGMYDALLVAHSWVRWAVLLLGLYAFVRAASGRFTRRPWTPADDAADRRPDQRTDRAARGGTGSHPEERGAIVDHVE